MRKKGFTLVELLAVIVIIGVIALITTPIIINTIEDVKTDAIRQSVIGYIDAVKKAIVDDEESNLKDEEWTYYIKDGNLYQDAEYETLALTVGIKGKVPEDGGTVTIDENGKIINYEFVFSESPIYFNSENPKTIVVGHKNETLIKNITFNDSKDHIEIGQSKSLNYQIYPANASSEYIRWEIEDSNIATISDNGSITGVNDGKTKAIASINGITKTIDITIGSFYTDGDIVSETNIYDLFHNQYEHDNGIYTANIGGVEIPFEMHVIKADTIYSATPTMCNDTADSIMCLYKYEGNLTINNDIKVTPQTRKKGFGIFVNGTLTNNGEISMTARGASAVGQNVILYINEDNSKEIIPAVGAVGGTEVYQNRDAVSSGNKGANGTDRMTGGGGSGTANSYSTEHYAYSGRGGMGTSYSGGSGGGGSHDGHCNRIEAGNGSSNGGAGGAGNSCPYNGYSAAEFIGGGGAGNSGGHGSYSVHNAASGYILNAINDTYKGQDGTGGLLMIYANDIQNNGSINSNGSQGGGGAAAGGSSGGGSINIFYNNNYSSNVTATVEAIGGASVTGWRGQSGAGGAGTVTVCKIKTGTCVK